MPASILATKLFVPPNRPNWVLRPHLLQKLNTSLRAGCKLTLVSAPAGFGKTTLITAWINALQTAPVTAQTAWLSLDAGDNDLVGFLHYLVAALQTRAPQVGQATLNLLQLANLPPVENLLLPLVNDLAQLSSPLVLVLDDYHLIHLPVIHEAVTFLIERQPPALHVAITTRQDPLLPLARWRARGLLTEIRLKDLRFSVSETGEFLNGTMGFVLQANAVAALENRTEGWIAGLQLAAVSLLQADLAGESGLAAFIESFTGNDRYVMDYLIDEVLDCQPEPIQRFLLQTSVLERFNAALCQAVLDKDDQPGSPDAPGTRPEDTLRYLEQANLFLIPLDNQREWYRYHHLFAELLQHRLAAGAGRAQASVLKQRASAWFAAQELANEAISYAQSAGDWALSCQHITRFGPGLLQRGQITQVLRWITALPDAVIRANPDICRIYGYLLSITARLNQGMDYLNLALQTQRDDPHHQGSALAFASYNACFRGEFEEEIVQAQRALTILPPGFHWERGIAAISLGFGLCHTDDPPGCEAAMREAYAAGLKSGTLRTCVIALTYLGRMSVLHLNFQQAQDEFELACSLQFDEQNGQYPACDVALLDLAQLKYTQNDLEQSQAYLERGFAANQLSGSIEMRAYAFRLAARLAQLRGEAQPAQEYLHKALQLTQDYNLSPLSLNLNAAMQVQMALSDERLADAERAADDLLNSTGLYSFYFCPELIRVELHLRQGRREAALRELDQCLRRALQPGWELPRVQVRALQALAETNRSQAQQYLREALALAAPAGAVRTFVDLGAPLRALLSDLRPQLKSTESAFADLVLRAFNQPASPSAAQTEADSDGLVEPLTERELQVLRLLAGGLSNAEIAARLVLSTNTLKAHTQNIYAKLDVHSRVQMMNKARMLGLLKG